MDIEGICEVPLILDSNRYVLTPLSDKSDAGSINSCASGISRHSLLGHGCLKSTSSESQKTESLGSKSDHNVSSASGTPTKKKPAVMKRKVNKWKSYCHICDALLTAGDHRSHVLGKQHMKKAVPEVKPQYCITITNFKSDVTEEVLYDHFSTVGIVKTVFIDGEEGSYGVVQFETKCCVIHATECLAGHILKDSKVTVIKGSPFGKNIVTGLPSSDLEKISTQEKCAAEPEMKETCNVCNVVLDIGNLYKHYLCKEHTKKAYSVIKAKKCITVTGFHPCTSVRALYNYFSRLGRVITLVIFPGKKSCAVIEFLQRCSVKHAVKCLVPHTLQISKITVSHGLPFGGNLPKMPDFLCDNKPPLVKNPVDKTMHGKKDLQKKNTQDENMQEKDSQEKGTRMKKNTQEKGTQVEKDTQGKGTKVEKDTQGKDTQEDRRRKMLSTCPICKITFCERRRRRHCLTETHTAKALPLMREGSCITVYGVLAETEKGALYDYFKSFEEIRVIDTRRQQQGLVVVEFESTYPLPNIVESVTTLTVGTVAYTITRGCPSLGIPIQNSVLCKKEECYQAMQKPADCDVKPPVLKEKSTRLKTSVNLIPDRGIQSEFRNALTSLKRKEPFVSTIAENHVVSNMKNSDRTNEATVYEKVHAILNELSPHTISSPQLVTQIQQLNITTEETLNEVVDLVYEKAISEPNCSILYAEMCKHMYLIKVKRDSEGKAINFRSVLLTKCQREFEKHVTDKQNKAKRMKLIKECETDEERKQHKEEEGKDASRQLGNTRFIGELFVLKMLTQNIIHQCIKELLLQGDEDCLECLCCLLTIVGKELENSNEVNSTLVESYFTDMKKIIDEENASSRVKVMLQCAIDLRMENAVKTKPVFCDACNVFYNPEQSRDHHTSKKHIKKAMQFMNEKCCIEVCGFSKDAKLGALYDYFGSYGKVKAIFIHKRKERAVVEFYDANSVGAAVKTKIPHMLQSRKLIVNRVKPRYNGGTPLEMLPPHNILMTSLQKCKNMHEQILLLQSSLLLSKQNKQARIDLHKLLTAILSQFFPKCVLHLFGSSVNSFGLQGSDVDMLFEKDFGKPNETEPENNSKPEIKSPNVTDVIAGRFAVRDLAYLPRVAQLDFIKKVLRRYHDEFHTVVFVPAAACPIVKFISKRYGLSCDVSNGNRLSVYNTELLHCYGMLDKRVVPLVTTLRYWAKIFNYIGTRSFSSYAFTLLIIFFLQTREPPILPSVNLLRSQADQKIFVDKFDCSFCTDPDKILVDPSANTQTLENLLWEFFAYYGIFDFGKFVVSPLTGRCEPKEGFDSNENSSTANFKISPVCIQDPFQTSRNVSSFVKDDDLACLITHFHRITREHCSSCVIKKEEGKTRPCGSKWGIPELFAVIPRQLKTKVSRKQKNMNTYGMVKIPLNKKVMDQVQKKYNICCTQCTNLIEIAVHEICGFVLDLMYDTLLFDIQITNDKKNHTNWRAKAPTMHYSCSCSNSHDNLNANNDNILNEKSEKMSLGGDHNFCLAGINLPAVSDGDVQNEDLSEKCPEVDDSSGSDESSSEDSSADNVSDEENDLETAHVKVQEDVQSAQDTLIEKGQSEFCLKDDEPLLCINFVAVYQMWAFRNKYKKQCNTNAFKSTLELEKCVSQKISNNQSLKLKCAAECKCEFYYCLKGTESFLRLKVIPPEPKPCWRPLTSFLKFYIPKMVEISL